MTKITSKKKIESAKNTANVTDPSTWNFATKCLQAGWKPKIGEPRVLPIFQSTTYKYEDVDEVERLFALKQSGNKYTRTGNPTVAAFESKITELEGGVGAVATASGQAAVLLAISNLVKAGDHIVASKTIYGGSYTLLSVRLSKLGETIGNPALGILDFEKFSKLAKEFDVPFLVDNTLATPFLVKPLKLGANVVIHSATKYIDGHAVALGGVVIDGGNYNWENGKFPDLVEPDAQYANTSYTQKFGRAAFIAKARAQFLRDYGAALSPFNAFLLNLGLETLHLRMPQHSNNALALAEFLSKHPAVNWVSYPGLKSSPYFKRIRKYFDYQGGSGVLTFGLKGGRAAIRSFVKALKVAALVVHVGDARTSVLHPATSTHSQLSPKDRLAAGIPEDMIRVSVGIEDPRDIIADFEQAIAASTKGGK